jgi:hypothetical protein
MSLRFLIFAGLLAPSLTSSARSQTSAAEEAGVRKALEHYLQGHATGDGNHHRLAFYPQANLYWVRNGALATRTSDDYANASPGKPAADEAQRKRRVVSIDITGTAAIAKIELDYPTVRFVDYMSLLKVDGEWRIIAKIFNAEPKS